MRTPKKPFHPGEILLEEFLEPMEVSQYRLAKEIGGSTLVGAVKVTRGIVKW